MGCPPSSPADHENEIDDAVLPVKTTFVGAAGALAWMTVIGIVGAPVPSMVVAETRIR